MSIFDLYMTLKLNDNNMKVKYLLKDDHLEYEREYNVFTIQKWTNWEEKYYIAEVDISWKYYITPFNSDCFDITDTKISKFWHYGMSVSWEKTIGIEEAINIKYFWNKYYDDDLDVNHTISLYYRVWKDELFNII